MARNKEQTTVINLKKNMSKAINVKHNFVALFPKTSTNSQI